MCSRRVLPHSRYSHRVWRGLLVREKRAQCAYLTAQLEALSPFRVLKRGYAIALHEASDQPIRSVTQVQDCDRIVVRVAEGEFSAQVNKS